MSRGSKKTWVEPIMNSAVERATNDGAESASHGPGLTAVISPMTDSLASNSVTFKKDTVSFKAVDHNGSAMHADTVIMWRKDADDWHLHSSHESVNTPTSAAASSGLAETPREGVAPATLSHKTDSCYSDEDQDAEPVTMVTLSLPQVSCDSLETELSDAPPPCTDMTEAETPSDLDDRKSMSSSKSTSPELASVSDFDSSLLQLDANDDLWYAASDSPADYMDSSCEQSRLLEPVHEGYEGHEGHEGVNSDSNKEVRSCYSGRDSGSGGSGFGSVHYSSNGEVNLNTPKTHHGKASDKKKKANWYNMLSPTYKSKSEDFKRIFKDLPSDERLLVDYSCALQKDILVHGRLYVTQNWVCFYANIFRWETVLTIKCKDIIAMTKEKTARVIPNALQIQTETEKYFFTSFGAREKTFLMLFRVWQNALMEQPMGAHELWQLVHYYYGDELGLNSSDEDYMVPSPDDLQKIHENDVGLSDDFCGKDKAELSDGAVSGEVSRHLSAPSSLQGLDTLSRSSPECSDARLNINKVNSAGQLQLPSPDVTAGADLQLTDQGDTTEDSEDDVVNFELPDVGFSGTTYLDEDFDISVDQAFDWLFSDSNFFRTYHSNRKTTDMKISHWTDEVASEGDKSRDGDKTRDMTYVLALTQSFGPKASPCIEKQRCYKESIAGRAYLVDADCYMNHIPYGESFYVVNRYLLTRKSRHKCHLRVECETKYRKSVWGPIRSIIEKNVTSGLKESFSSYAIHLRRECEKFAEIIAGPDVVAGQPIRKKVLRRRRTHSHSLTGERTPTTKRTTDTPQSSTQGTPVKSINHRASIDTGSAGYATDTLARVVCVLLLLLLTFNALLFYKLSSLEAKANLHISEPRINLENLNCPSGQSEWQDLLKEQRSLHQTEVDRWRDILSTSVTLMDEMKQALVELKGSIDKRMEEMKSGPDNT